MRPLAAIGRSGAQLGGVVTMARNSSSEPKAVRHLAHLFVVRVHHDRIAGRPRVAASPRRTCPGTAPA